MAELGGATELAYARRLRFVIALTVLCLLWWFVLDRLDQEAGKVEQVSANLMLSQLRSALVVKGAEVSLASSRSLEELKGINPVDLVQHRWPGYHGLCDQQKPAPGNWCFWVSIQKDTENHPKGWLIYRPHRPITLEDRNVAAGELTVWRVTTEFVDRNGNREQEPGERSTGLTLVRLSQREARLALSETHRNPQ